jgi:hypothetical protein
MPGRRRWLHQVVVVAAMGYGLISTVMAIPQSAEQRGFFRQQFYTESPCAKMVTHSSVEPPL